MNIDTLTLILGGALVLLAVVTPLLSAFFRRPKMIELEGEPDEPPHFSVVMAVHDNATELERNLPKLLTQDYATGYEVIVVDESSTDETDDVLTRLKAQYKNLYTTFIPESSHYLSRRKLALTLGVKAAKHEWIVFTEANCTPESDQWLTTLARYTDDADIVCGYTGYQEATGFWKFYRLLTNCYALRRPRRYEGNNLAFRRQLFMENNGFLRNLRYLRGEYDFLVNEYGEKHRVVTMTEPAGHVRQEEPTPKSWLSKQLYYMETRKHLHGMFLSRLLFNVDQLALHLNYWLEAAAIAYSVMAENWVLCGAAATSLLLPLPLRLVFASRAIRAFGEDIPLWRVPLMELRVVWQNAYYLIRHRFSDKYDYIRK